MEKILVLLEEKVIEKIISKELEIFQKIETNKIKQLEKLLSNCSLYERLQFKYGTNFSLNFETIKML